MGCGASSLPPIGAIGRVDCRPLEVPANSLASRQVRPLPTTAEAYTLQGLLGEGNLARVYLVECAAAAAAGGEAGSEYAMKVMYLKDVTARQKKSGVQTERHILQRSNRHPFVVQLSAAFFSARYEVNMSRDPLRVPQFRRVRSILDDS